MINRGLQFTVIGIVGLLAFAGCATEATGAAEDVGLDEAPAVDGNGLAAQDNGSSYGGWVHYILGYTQSGYVIAEHTMVKQSGSVNTRGGGACIVYEKTGSSCSNDTTCTTAAESQFGSEAHGYCWQGKCYSRPGSTAAFCGLNPNRSPGTLGFGHTTAYYPGHSGLASALGCMTKGAGPNTACGCEPGLTYWEGGVQKSCGSNPQALYMRIVVPVSESDPGGGA